MHHEHRPAGPAAQLCCLIATHGKIEPDSSQQFGVGWRDAALLKSLGWGMWVVQTAEQLAFGTLLCHHEREDTVVAGPPSVPHVHVRCAQQRSEAP